MMLQALSLVFEILIVLSKSSLPTSAIVLMRAWRFIRVADHSLINRRVGRPVFFALSYHALSYHAPRYHSPFNRSASRPVFFALSYMPLATLPLVTTAWPTAASSTLYTLT